MEEHFPEFRNTRIISRGVSKLSKIYFTGNVVLNLIFLLVFSVDWFTLRKFNNRSLHFVENFPGNFRTILVPFLNFGNLGSNRKENSPSVSNS